MKILSEFKEGKPFHVTGIVFDASQVITPNDFVGIVLSNRLSTTVTSLPIGSPVHMNVMGVCTDHLDMAAAMAGATSSPLNNGTVLSNRLSPNVTSLPIGSPVYMNVMGVCTDHLDMAAAMAGATSSPLNKGTATATSPTAPPAINLTEFATLKKNPILVTPVVPTPSSSSSSFAGQIYLRPRSEAKGWFEFFRSHTHLVHSVILDIKSSLSPLFQLLGEQEEYRVAVTDDIPIPPSVYTVCLDNATAQIDLYVTQIRTFRLTQFHLHTGVSSVLPTPAGGTPRKLDSEKVAS